MSSTARIVVFLEVRNDDLTGIANEKTVRHRTQPVAIDLRQQVMRHLLLIKNAFALRHAAGQRLDHSPPIGLTVRNHFTRAGMIAAGDAQIMRVEWFIAHERVGRFPHDRIIAVEILRGPDHMAMRTGSFSCMSC